MPSPVGHVGDAPTSTSPPGVFGNSWSGGTGQFPPVWAGLYPNSPPNLSAEKSSSAQAKSSAFLTLTYAATGKKLLVAKDSISNILQLDEGCNIFYKNNPDGADHVSECFTYIESELLK